MRAIRATALLVGAIVVAAACNNAEEPSTCDGFYLLPSSATVARGDSVPVLAVRQLIDPASGTCANVPDLGTRYLWSSNNAAVATVDTVGLVRTVTVGQAIITAEIKPGREGAGRRAQMSVAVLPAGAP